MTVAARKYNPGFLSDDEIVASFCVRAHEFDSMIDVLGECTGQANAHQIVIGPRGSGKTSLLLRVAAEMRRNTSLSARFFPVVFAEESYEVSTAGEFWLECLSRLADQAPFTEDDPDLRRTFAELRQIRDDRTLEGRCLGVLQDFSDRQGKRLVLIVENLNMLFRDIADRHTGWRLRQALQTEPRIVLLASATSRFDEIDDPKRALYDLFRVLPLRALDAEECATLWQTVSGQCRAPQTIQALRILTGGSPRLLTIVARFGANLSFRELMADLLDLVDDHTEYFKSHLDALPAQERRVYLALADLWKPATAREIADRARLDTSKCSAQLARLTERGAVEITGGTTRRKLYYLAERLYNIYYLMRRARGPAPLIEALIRFMEGYYSAHELKEFGARIAQEALSVDGKALGLYRTAFEQLVELPSLEAHRKELLSLTPATFPYAATFSPTASAGPSAARQLSRKAVALAQEGRVQEAVETWDEVVRRFGEHDAIEDIEQVWLALSNKGSALVRLRRAEEALSVLDEVVRRFRGNNGRAFPHAIPMALLNKGKILLETNRAQEALAACDEVVRHGEAMHGQVFQGYVAKALAGKSVVLLELNRPNEALTVCDEILDRFGGSDAMAYLGEVAMAMAGRGAALLKLNRLNDAVSAWDGLLQRFGDSKAPEIVYRVATALANKAAALLQLQRPKEALALCNEVTQRFVANETPAMSEVIAGCLISKGNALLQLNRLEEALAAWDEVVVGPLRASASVPLLEPVATALMNKGAALVEAGRPADGLVAWGEVVRRLETIDHPRFLIVAANALARMGALLQQLGRHQEALEVWQKVDGRFGDSDAPEIIEVVAGSIVNMAATLLALNRPAEALETCDRAVQRFSEHDAPSVLNAVATALASKGTFLMRLNRDQEAVAAWRELDRRFGSADAPVILGHVAMALANTGSAFFNMNRPEDAVAAWSEVILRFGVGGEQMYLEAVGTAVVNKRTVLGGWLNRPEEALAVCDDALRRFGTDDSPMALEVVADCLVNKGGLLVRLNRDEEALATWDEAIRRFGATGSPALRNAADMALIARAELELGHGRAKTAIETVDQVLKREDYGFPETRWRGHLLRAQAHLEEGDEGACARDVEAVLTILPVLNFPPRDALQVLSRLAVDFGPAQMRELVKASPAADLLLPLTTALERDLGMEPRVAKEIEEVAEDIRRDMEGWAKRSDG